MAAAYVKIMCERGKIRVYGGNKSDVRGAVEYYKNMSLEEFLERHPHCTEADYNTLETVLVIRRY